MKAIVVLLAGLLACSGAASAADAASAGVPDTLAQRALACTGCHGAQGRVSAEGYIPRIAGKPEGYLLRQLLAFRDGRRANASMARLIEHLGDDYLRELAAYFARLELPYVQTPDARPRATVDADARARADTLLQRGDAARELPACADCHGRALTGVAPDVPGLLGLPRDYLVAQLGAWRNGARRAAAPDCMAQIARRLADADVPVLADALAAQPLPPRMAPASVPPAARWPMDCGSLAR